MTLVVALKGTDGMVLAGDSRGTFGDPRATTAQNDSMTKLYALSKYVGVVTAGDAGLATRLISAWLHANPPAQNGGLTDVTLSFYGFVRQQYAVAFPGFAIQQVAG
jgi:hypothetical protein